MKKKGNEYIDPLEKLHEAADPSLNKNTKSKKESKKAESADKEEAKEYRLSKTKWWSKCFEASYQLICTREPKN
jgi:hypothetical protein